MSFKLIHLSDLHFHSFPRNFSEWNSKRALGALNLLLFRQKHYPLERAKALVHYLQSVDYDYLVISGDLTSLALPQEFQIARQICDPLLKNSQSVTVIPGNHDSYVDEACSPNLFAQYFSAFFIHTDSIKNGQPLVKTQILTENWQLIAWDSTHPNPWNLAAGTVWRETVQETEAYMQSQPEGTRFVLVNHYPIWFPQYHVMKRSHELHNLSAVQQWVFSQPSIQVYLHGHVHHNWYHQQQRKSMPPLHNVNSASSTKFPLKSGRSAFHQVMLNPENVEVQAMIF